MVLETIDWLIIASFFVVATTVGLLVARRAGSSTSEFFLSGRRMPWWLLGMSMVATTFSTDTPNLVTDIVRQNGVAGNWIWWAFLLTGMLTVFVYARLWRRSGVMTDIEFYELRYSGKSAAFLRGFRAVYLGMFFNVMIMATVTLAAIKIGGVMLGLSPLQTVLIAGAVTVIYSSLGGFMGVLLTDMLLFVIAMGGSIVAAYYAVNLPEVGGLSALLAHEAVKGKLSLLPDFSNTEMVVSLLVIPLAVQWWSVWYPGSEPGGGGYIAQRMLAAKNEKNAIGATLFFNCAHYALRPWPWILVALASLVVYPDLASLREAFPHIKESVLRDDLAYPAMLTYLPAGLLGLVVASLIAAYMSTVSTHLNLGSSYIVNDFYKRFIRPDATEKQLVFAGRVTTVLLMILATSLSLWLNNAMQAFKILLQIGAGTGLLFILRWFWWRINAYSELTAMVVSFLIALGFLIQQKLDLLPIGDLADWQKLVIGVAITTVCWVTVTLVTRPSDDKTLRNFFRVIRPGGPGWNRVLETARQQGDPVDVTGAHGVLPTGVLCMVIGCFAVYSALFATGYWLYGKYSLAAVLTLVSVMAAVALVRLWGKVSRS
jgi:solute:Na+ symporter, SSS family